MYIIHDTVYDTHLGWIICHLEWHVCAMWQHNLNLQRKVHANEVYYFKGMQNQ